MIKMFYKRYTDDESVIQTLCQRVGRFSICRDGADTPMPPYIGKAIAHTNVEDLDISSWFASDFLNKKHSQNTLLQVYTEIG